MTQHEQALVEAVLLPERPKGGSSSIPRLALVAVLVVAGDLCVYQGGGGFAGWGLFAAISVLLILFGIGRWDRRSVSVGLLIMLTLSITRLFWQGNVGIIVAVSFQLMAFAMAQQGMVPFIPELCAFIGRIFPLAALELPENCVSSLGLATRASRGRWLAFGLPLGVSLAFMIPFLLANPDQITWFVKQMELVGNFIWDWWSEMAVGEIVVWILLATLGLGVFSPRNIFPSWLDLKGRSMPSDLHESLWYVPVRNTLLAVIVVFLMYLVFEFQSLWFREFPENFHYSGYAHQGAAWLTVALGMTTIVLSCMFQGRLLDDPRICRLHRLAWLWSALNFLLAISVYHRLWIYVGFNGMTRMRIIGIFGISCVVIGFILVVYKIRYQRPFAWLLQYQLMALAVMSSLLSITPMDAMAYSYNTRQILAGQPAPLVQITEHPMTPDGWLAAWPLVHSSDSVVREGVLAMLAEQMEPSSPPTWRPATNVRKSWQWFQISKARLQRKLRDNASLFAAFASDAERRRAAIELFKSTAYKWY